MRLLGLDYGARRIGVALGDTESRVASPWAVIEVVSIENSIERIQEMLATEHAEAVVLGIPKPIHERALENDQVREVKTFGDLLRAQHICVEEIDETLSSKQAARQMHERGEKGKRDDLAAAVILQAWLDRRS